MQATTRLSQILMTFGYSQLQILQANVRKSHEVSHSLFNDNGLKNFSFLFLTEPATAMRNNEITTVPLFHSVWTPIFPSKLRTNTHYNNGHFRAMIWYNKSLSHIRQIPIAHSDICAVITRIASRTIFLASVYVPCSSGALEKDNRRLESKFHWIRTAYRQEKDQCPEL